ncbi:uncharacterized protein [Eurosta solidaginis]|uniref:uncharacterized protein isoform X2 n=1 Tax=Eurosta solidaginis TaxID=178769 RepID=UPI0035314752
MTFYWWSHWFWITTLSNILLSITIVQAYPSQEISLEYNQNSKTVKAITKLHPATTSIESPKTTTTEPTTTASTPLTQTLERGHVIESSQNQSQNEDTQTPTGELATEKEADIHNIEAVESSDTEIAEDASLEEENIVETDKIANGEQWEYKRSAEVKNKTLENDDEYDDDYVEEPRVAAVIAQPRSASIEQSTSMLKKDDEVISNYTNHSRIALVERTNIPCKNCNSTGHDLNSTKSSPTNFARSASVPISNLSATSINSTPTETLEWLNAMAAAAAVPPSKLLTNAPQSEEIDSGIHTVARQSSSSEKPVGMVTATATVQQRIPFTLENANKEDELRRAENEHRSRKSKVLSAEYKHISRFINYSSDTKSLLTRSAARSGFDGGEENNISSEALSVQRTYFMDAGAISAICFTIFGVCCTVGTVGIVLYRRRYLNKPQTLSEPDSSVYIDDSTMRVSDNSDEMYSLDNDSFLNSLEAMTIQNYWTDTVKHTKL